MEHAQKILKNTLLLTAASFLMQTVGVSFNVWLTNRLGADGMGLFQLIMTVYGLAVTLGGGGARLACTRLTVESIAHSISPKSAVRKCIRYALLTGLLASFALFTLSDIAAKYWLNNTWATMPLKVLALSLPFVAMSGSLNGYFTAVGKIGRYSLVRIAEQGVKIVIVMASMNVLISKGTSYGCMAIVIGILISECFSFIVLYVLYIIEKQMYSSKKHFFTIQKMLHIALPDVTGAGARSVLLTIEHLLIPRGFRASGASSESALTIYGNIHGMVFPLLLYPSAILSSLSGLLIPEIAGNHSKGNTKQITYMQRRVLRMTLLFAFASASVFYAFADLFSEVIYHSTDCSFYIRILSPLIPVMYCDMTVDGLLKGLDEQKASMRYNILDSGICVVLVYFLLPRFAEKGYIFILFLSEILNFFLSVRRLCKVSTVDIHPGEDIIVPMLCGICSSAFMNMLNRFNGWYLYGNYLCLALVSVTTILLYVLMLYGFGAITKEDFRWFKKTCTIQPLKVNLIRRKTV